MLDWKSLSATPLAEVKWDAPRRPARDYRTRLAAHQTVARGPDQRRAGGAHRCPVDRFQRLGGAPGAGARREARPCGSVLSPTRTRPRPTLRHTTSRSPIPRQRARAGSSPSTRNCGRDLRPATATPRKTWRTLLAMLGFFEQHRKWSEWEPWGALGILSAFSGEYEFLGRKCSTWPPGATFTTACWTALAPPGPPPAALKAILYVDAAAPTPQWKAALDGFARRGGTADRPARGCGAVPGWSRSAFAPSPATRCGRWDADGWRSRRAIGTIPTFSRRTLTAWSAGATIRFGCSMPARSGSTIRKPPTQRRRCCNW